MQLREHPYMFYRQHRSWPPVWTSSGGVWEKHQQTLQGEIGVLKTVRCYPPRPGIIYLTMAHEESEYMGCLLFDDAAFCLQTAEHLQRLCGTPIEEIGSSKIASPLDPHASFESAQVRDIHFAV